MTPQVSLLRFLNNLHIQEQGELLITHKYDNIWFVSYLHVNSVVCVSLHRKAASHHVILRIRFRLVRQLRRSKLVYSSCQDCNPDFYFHLVMCLPYLKLMVVFRLIDVLAKLCFVNKRK